MFQYHHHIERIGTYGARSEIKLLEKSSPASAASTPDARCTQMIHKNHVLGLIWMSGAAFAKLFSILQGGDGGHAVKTRGS